ncbi:hypothetical protein ES705_07744 [subsurface metagenome]
MALNTKWASGNLIFYDGTQDIFTIKKSTGGILVGESGEGIDFTMYGETTGAYFHFDESADLVDFHNIKITNQAPNTVESTSTMTLTSTSNRFQFVDTTGALDVKLPLALAKGSIGIQYFIANTSTATLTIYDGYTTGDVVAEISQYESGILVNDGNVWRGIVATATG